MTNYSIGINWKRGMVEQLEVDWDAMPDAAKTYIIQYGLKQTLNDAGASAETEEAKVTDAQKRLDSLMDGVVPSGGGGGDPIAARMRKLARDAVDKALRAENIKRDDVDKDKYKALVAKYVDKNAEMLRKAAKAAIEAERGAKDADVDIDLSSLKDDESKTGSKNS